MTLLLKEEIILVSIQQNKVKEPQLYLYIIRVPGSISLRCIHSQYLNIDTYYQSDVSKLSFIPSMNKQKFIILNFLKSYINLNDYNNQNIEINYDIVFDKREDHNERYYFNVLIVDLNNEIFQHLINESTSLIFTRLTIH